MKKCLVLLMIIVCCSCAQDKKENIERICNVSYTVLTDSIFTRMPGKLLYSDKYIVWIDPFASKNFVHVLDASSGKELGCLGNIGNGPHEFTGIFASLTYDSLIVLSDLNRDLQGYINLNRVETEPSTAFVKWRYDKLNKFTRYLEISESQSLLLYPGANKPFVYKHNEKNDSIGRFPFNEKIVNGYNIYQGEMFYNAERGCLFYSTFYIPYAAMYKLEDDKFVMEWEWKEDIDYNIVNGKLKINNQFHNFHEIALTKDYIVVCKRDVETEGELSKDIKKKDPMRALPYSIFLYDYDYNLKKIVKLETPIIRVAGNASCNVLYAIITNPEFALVKFELPI